MKCNHVFDVTYGEVDVLLLDPPSNRTSLVDNMLFYSDFHHNDCIKVGDLKKGFIPTQHAILLWTPLESRPENYHCIVNGSKREAATPALL